MTEAVIRNKAGMASVKDMPVLQDGPPPGVRAGPIRAACSEHRPQRHGHFFNHVWRFLVGNVPDWQRKQDPEGIERKKKYSARRAIIPVLQAEEDERFVKEWKKYLEEEARIMKDVPGWKVGENVYHSGRWMPPATGERRPDIW